MVCNIAVERDEKTENRMKRVRISNESVNSYGFRVLTDGLDTSQYERNPVLLYMHQRGQIIGYMKDLKKANGELTGEPVFDEATELSKQLKRQFEFGSLRMVSASLEPKEVSEDAEQIVEGQTRATVTKSKLIEVSLVDIGANDDATVLVRDGKRIELSEGSDSFLPLLITKEDKDMNMKTIALQLGLPETADEAAIIAKIGDLQKNAAKAVELKKSNDELLLSGITSAVDAAIDEKKIEAEKKDDFVSLGKEVGLKKLKSVLGAMSPRVSLSSLVGRGSAGSIEWKKLSDVPSDKLAALKKENLAEYKRLYKAEYGMEMS